MSTIKIMARFVRGYYTNAPYFETEDGRYFTFPGWMGASPENSDVQMYLSKYSTLHHRHKFRIEIYPVKKEVVAETRYNGWKYFGRKNVLVEITNPVLHKPRLIMKAK